MLKYRLSSLMLASLLGLTACGGDDDQTSSNDAPVNRTFAVFSPATSKLPVPSDLQFSSETAGDGTMNAGTDPTNPVITGIDALDGNSVLAPFDIQFSGSLNTAQGLSAANFVVEGSGIIPNPNQNVFLLPLEYPSGDGLVHATVAGVDVEVPTFAEALAYRTAAAAEDVATLSALASPAVRAEIISLDGGTNNVIRINPLKPLKAKTKYLVVITSVEDLNGVPVLPSEAYAFIRDPETDFAQFGAATAATFNSLRGAIQGWERLATGYFGFQQTVFDAASPGTSAPDPADIIFSMTFTTGGTTDVLTYMAAPEKFFEDSLTAGYKKDAIQKLVDGTFTLSATPPTAPAASTDESINQTLNFLLTTAEIASAPNPLYNATVAGAIAAGADYATISADASAAYLMQRAAGEAAIQVQNGASPTIMEQAIGSVAGIAGANPVTEVFQVPGARSTNFYRLDAASAINPALAAPARIYQGDITLPYYQESPTAEDLTPVVSSRWTANPTIGGAIDFVRGNDPGTTPPSDMITYRYPFPTKKSDVTVPLLVATPDETVLGSLGVTKPAEGWPVIVFVHGITSDRSTILPMANALAFACIGSDDAGTPVARPGVPCFASIAIDQPLHGVVPSGSLVSGLVSVNDPTPVTPNIGDNVPTPGLSERHFDVTADASLAPTAMDYDTDFGSSGSLFVNLTNFTNVRDNLRQMSIDLLNLNASISTMDLDDDGTADDLDPSKVYFIGHSLGAIDGLPFVAVNNSAAVQNSTFSDQPKVQAAAGLVTGGGITRLLANSQSFAPNILQGLAAASDALTQGNSGLESYFSVFQGVLDSVDVTNFAKSLSDSYSDTGVLLTQVAGDGTIPNAADSTLGTGPLNTTVEATGFQINNFPAPLAGTEPMIAQFGATNSDTVSGDGDAEVLVTRFSEGGHGTPVTADNIAVFTEMVSQIVTFFTFNGNVSASIVSNEDVIVD